MTEEEKNWFRKRRDFKGIWIPAEIWLIDHKELSTLEKIIFAEIHSLDNADGCYASNKYFAEFFGISERQIRTYIASLKDKGLVSVEIKNQNQRIIRVIGKFARLSDNDISKKIDEIGKKWGRKK